MGLIVKLNGAEERIGASTVIELLRARGIDPQSRGVAVALNGAVVRRSDWPATQIRNGDAIDIMRPFSGG